MIKKSTIVFLICAMLFSCEEPIVKKISHKTDLELDLINTILPNLIPEHTPCVIAPKEDELREKYDKRLDAFYAHMDSSGKKIEIINTLYAITSSQCEAYKRISQLENLCKASKSTRNLNSKHFRPIPGIKCVVMKESEIKLGGLSDCSVLGQFHFSRVGFNSDSTRAIVQYTLSDGSCTGLKGGIILAKRHKGKWLKIQTFDGKNE